MERFVIDVYGVDEDAEREGLRWLLAKANELGADAAVIVPAVSSIENLSRVLGRHAATAKQRRVITIGGVRVHFFTPKTHRGGFTGPVLVMWADTEMVEAAERSGPLGAVGAAVFEMQGERNVPSPLSKKVIAAPSVPHPKTKPPSVGGRQDVLTDSEPRSCSRPSLHSGTNVAWTAAGNQPKTTAGMASNTSTRIAVCTPLKVSRATRASRRLPGGQCQRSPVTVPLSRRPAKLWKSTSLGGAPIGRAGLLPIRRDLVDHGVAQWAGWLDSGR